MMSFKIINFRCTAFVLACFTTYALAEDINNHSAHPSLIQGGITGRVIVKIKHDSSLLIRHAYSETADITQTIDAASARAASLGSRLALSMRSGRVITEHAQVVTAEGVSSIELAKRLAADPDVEYAVEDQRRKHFGIPNDPLFNHGPAIIGNSGGPVAGQWYLRAPSAEVLSGINATAAWDLTTGSNGVVVAILDTGVRGDHPDLANRLLPGYDMVSNPQIANDVGGRDGDASDPGDWVSTSDISSGGFGGCEVSDSSWHGTQMASIVGAGSNNGVGMAGIAWQAKLLPVRVLGKCGGYDSDIIAGMYWAAGLPVPGVPVNPNPAQVINLSLGGDGACSPSYAEAIAAITNKSIPTTIVVAAGNSAGHALGSPANCPGVITVIGLRHMGTKVGFSDLGAEATIAAPGGNCVNTGAGEPCLYPILAATNSGTMSPQSSTYTDSFNASLGTSYSAAIVSGTVALMLSIDPTLRPSQVKNILQTTARAFPTPASASDPVPVCQTASTMDQLECYCTTVTCGAGMLDTASAVKATTFPFITIASPVHRFFNTNAGGHFFTISGAEKDTVLNNYSWFRYEGVGFYAFPTQFSGTLPVYRFFNTNAGGHFFTISQAERDFVIGNYNWFRYEGVGFYAFPTQFSGTKPVYRFFNTNAGGHFFTIGQAEKDFVIGNYDWFRYEGIGFNAYSMQ